jgi:hypothetical protein
VELLQPSSLVEPEDGAVVAVVSAELPVGGVVAVPVLDPPSTAKHPVRRRKEPALRAATTRRARRAGCGRRRAAVGTGVGERSVLVMAASCARSLGVPAERAHEIPRATERAGRGIARWRRVVDRFPTDCAPARSLK